MTNEFIEKYVPKKYKEAIEEVYKDMDGYWITLKSGYTSTATETETIHEYTIADIRKQFKTIEKVENEESSEIVAPGKQISILDFDDYSEDYFELESDMALLNEDVTELIIRNRTRNGEKVTRDYKIVIAGTLGLWNGSPFGYIEQYYGNFTLFLNDYNTTVFVEKDGTLEVKYSHHDGAHYMNVYLLPDNIDITELPVNQVEHVVSQLVPLKIDKQFASDYVILEGGETVCL